MEKTEVEYIAKMKDGTVIKIYPDKHHHRAYTAPGKEIGQPFVKLSDLLASLGATLATAEGAGAPSEWPEPSLGDKKEIHDRSRCGHFEKEICGMDKTACDGMCGQHASRAGDQSVIPQAAADAPKLGPEAELPPLTGGEPIGPGDEEASESEQDVQ